MSSKYKKIAKFVTPVGVIAPPVIYLASLSDAPLATAVFFSFSFLAAGMAFFFLCDEE